MTSAAAAVTSRLRCLVVSDIHYALGRIATVQRYLIEHKTEYVTGELYGVTAGVHLCCILAAAPPPPLPPPRPPPARPPATTASLVPTVLLSLQR